MSDVEPIGLLRKISTKTVMGKIPDKPEKQTNLFTVYGVAEDTKSDESSYGMWTALLGDFEVIRLEDGKRFRGPVAFLPEPFMTMTIKAVERAKASNEQAGGSDVGVEFACVVGIRPGNTKTGYEYTCDPLTEHRASDRLERLRALSMASVKRLPAPAVEKKADEKTVAKQDGKSPK